MSRPFRVLNRDLDWGVPDILLAMASDDEPLGIWGPATAHTVGKMIFGPRPGSVAARLGFAPQHQDVWFPPGAVAHHYRVEAATLQVTVQWADDPDTIIELTPGGPLVATLDDPDSFTEIARVFDTLYIMLMRSADDRPLQGFRLQLQAQIDIPSMEEMRMIQIMIHTVTRMEED